MWIGQFRLTLHVGHFKDTHDQHQNEGKFKIIKQQQQPHHHPQKPSTCGLPLVLRINFWI